MKILHVHTQAGVAQVLAKSLNKLGHQSRVYHHYNNEVGFKFNDIYGDVVDLNYRNYNKYIGRWHVGDLVWRLDVLRKARKYDIIHIHDQDHLVPILKRFYKKKPIVLTYHGTKIRNRWPEREKFWIEADMISVVSPGLIEEKTPFSAIHIPNPVDTEHFNRLNPIIPNTALYLYKHDLYEESLERVKEIAKKMGLLLIIIDRRKNIIPYPIMPRYLELFEYLFDIHQAKDFGYIIKGLINLIGYNALAMGCKVIDSEGKILSDLPEEMKSENIAKRWIEHYEELLLEELLK